MAASDSQKFTNEWSRLAAAMGVEALTRMQAASALLIGLGGLGAEIAKNVVLMGLRKVTVVDPHPVEIADLSSNFFFSESDVGKPRGATSLPHLTELNPRVILEEYSGPLDADFLKGFSVVVSTNNRSLSELLRISSVCHEHKVKFVAADSRGLFGMIFTDFNEHVVLDKNGEPSKTAYISGITREAEGVVTCVEGERHDLEDGDFVSISEVDGMSEINGQEFRVKVIGPESFSIGDTRSFSAYKARGMMREVKKPILINYQSLEENIKGFRFDKTIHPDGEKLFTAGGDFFVFFQALLSFQEAHSGRCPRPYHKDDFAELLAIANDINSRTKSVDSLNTQLLRSLTYTSAGDLSPMATFLGGVVAQEVMKACSAKFQPIDQFLFFDSLLSVTIPERDEDIDPAEYAAVGSRYDGQIAVFGKTFHTRLTNLKYFLVGSGAIGCEMLKTWALMGISAGPEGSIHVTDMDVIEISNLNRQFLFRAQNVGSSKSEVAAAAVRRMNPEIKVFPSKTKVAPETTAAFPPEFWRSLSGVCNALDNIEARKYVDQLCVRYGKSLLESGTSGPKGNTQVVVPHITESYSSSADPPSPSIPLCSLHTFPARIEHTLAWARQVVFQEVFVERMENVRHYFADSAFISKQQEISRRKIVEGLEEDLLTHRPSSFDDCINWALKLFNQHYHEAVLQLLSVFPRDYVDKNGAPFYTGTKRPPHELRFDPNQQDHLDFVVAASFLRAYCFGIIPSELKPADYAAQRAAIAAKTASYVHPPFVPKSNTAVVLDNNDAQPAAAAGTASEGDDSYIARVVSSLSSVSPVSVSVIEFEKDDDENFHVDFVNAASNLRATNFEIPTVDRLQSKLIAGKIIPAMITTTAAVTGLVCFELYKLYAPVPNTIAAYRNSFLNLAISQFQQSDPVPPAGGMTFNGKPFTLWDRIDIEPEPTFAQLFEIFLDTYNMQVEMVAYGPALIWSSLQGADKRAERLHKKISEVIKEVTKSPLLDSIVPITVMGEDVDGNEVENTPDIYVHIS